MLSIFGRYVSGGDKLGFLKTDSLSVSKYINASLCCLKKTQNIFIKSSAICVYVGSKYVTLLSWHYRTLGVLANKKALKISPRPHAPLLTCLLWNTAIIVLFVCSSFLDIIINQFCLNNNATQNTHVQKCLQDINAIFGQRTFDFNIYIFTPCSP